MASIDYEPKLLAILSTSIFVSCIFVSSTGLVAALDDSALLASEGKALLESGWWSDYSNLTPYRCNWTGIVCDRAGSITEISPPPEVVKVGNKFAKMNFSCFSNLVRLHLAKHELSGSIPPQISILPQLRHLNLSSNNLTVTIISQACSLNLPPPFDFYFTCDLLLRGKITDDSATFKATAFEGNKYLHPDFSNCSLPSKTNRRIHSIKIFLPITTILLCLLCLGCCYLSRCKATQPEPASSKNGDLFSIWNYDGTIAYEDIIAATKNFDLRYCIGTVGYGSVYRAQLPNEIVIQNICIIATLAFSCLHSNPKSRPSMKFVSQEFLSSKRSLAGLEISLLELRTLGMHANGGDITVPS
ncbi:hypothetical protein NC651_004776 [Populus alba x Populus x berolinensis]|nr:hypothetical protein NC651_004776 [Populus alba x Populus x berolinensis]